MRLAADRRLDAVIVGSGPNGLAAAVELAREGLRVRVVEANETVGGGARSAELTLPGFVHDVCSAVHPLALSSRFFSELPLADFGLEWIHPDAPLAHPLDGEEPVLLERSLEATAAALGEDGEAWRRLFEPGFRHWDALAASVLAPLSASQMLRHPAIMARFGLSALCSARRLCERSFLGARARALFAGMAAHSTLELERAASAAFGLVLGIAGHAAGWPLPRGGSQQIVSALAGYLRSLGGEIVTGVRITSFDELPSARLALLDVTPRQLLRIGRDRFPGRYRRALAAYRYGPGAFKIDWALSGPIPWTSSACARAGTVHLGGDFEALAASERAPWRGVAPDEPFVLLAQPSLFDATRAPKGNHTAWAYCHVPSGCDEDMTSRIEAQIERFAPGFRERVLARRVTSPSDMERDNANHVGGDISGGVQDLGQLFTRPAWRRVPYSTPLPKVFLCSASTPPGGGVHGLCGFYAARAALRAL
jgi:phytoene dehydrogenase-like protein